MNDFLTITCHNAYNYGAVLQTYALYKYLREIELNGKVIDYRPSDLHKTKSDKIIVKLFRPIIRYLDFKKGDKIFGNFLNENIELTSVVHNSNEILNVEKTKCYITGSDQVWNCSKNGVGNDENYFLVFADGRNVKKVSYAASIAMDKIDDKQKEKFNRLLADFSYISVREKTGVKILNDIGIQNVSQVLDPVYLISRVEWKNMARRSKYYDKLKNQNYILVYGFLRQKNVYDYAFKLAKKNNCKVYNVNTMIEDYFLKTDKYFWNVTPEDFLALILNANSIVTNSFHGLSFSIIFQKDFYLFGKDGNTSSRMFDLVNMLKLDDRVVRKGNVMSEEKIDYCKCNEILMEKIKESKEYLKKVFEEEKK